MCQACGQLGCRVPFPCIIDQSVGNERVNVRVEIEIFTKGVQGHQEGGLTLGQV